LRYQARPRDAFDRGIATVDQDLAMIPLMSSAGNFFMGREPGRGKGAFGGFDIDEANRIAKEEMAKIGIDARAIADSAHRESDSLRKH